MSDPKKPTTGMLIDGVFASEAIDSSGEIVSIDGMDITTLEEGQGVANYEHLGEDSNYGREIVGKIIYVKKIRKESDCENDRQKNYWNQIKHIPFLYGIVRLYDGAGNEGSKALASMIRDHVANDEPILVRYSIEGTTTKKEGNKIAHSIAKKVALTLKPCNKTAISGLMSDPNAPEDFPGIKKYEAQFLDPEFSPLGGSVTMTCNPCMDRKTEASARLLAAAMTISVVKKALAAGNMDVAPSQLTGGAALQRQDIRSTAKAALRDYGWDKPFRRHEFKVFAKAKLPEVSDDFLEHFSDIAEAYSVKRTLAKKEPAVKEPTAKPAKPAKTPKPAVQAPAVIIPAKHQATNHAVLEDIPDSHEDMPDEMLPPSTGNPHGRNIACGTVRGKNLKPNVGLTRPQFDAKKGILHTPVGSFKAYLPQHDGQESADNYQKILAHPDIEHAMDTALTNWTKVHKLLKAGKLPPEVVMHAVMFSQLSPNKPVPTQEIQYARLVDAMDATGIDPRHPGFEDIEEPYTNLDRGNVLPHTSREEFARNPAYYTGGKVGVEHDENGDIKGKPSETGRYPGELLSARPLFQDFLGRASQYHTIHDSIVNLVNKHKANGFDAVSELMDQKRQGANHKNTRNSAIKAGKEDPGAFKGLNVPGLKVKTGLYTWGMLGNGDSLVPDTHQVRNLYGLDLNKDAATIDYLKQMHWRPTNMKNLMAPLNDWYLKNHPAVQYTLNHPKWGSSFERPQDALFPSFWRHWLTIQPHEKFLGLPNMSEQAGTTHAPFWDTIRPHVDDALSKLGKTERGDTSLALRTALVHQQYVKDYGEVPAMFLYAHHLLPKLLEAGEHRRRVGTDMKFLEKARRLEAGLIELKKTIDTAVNGNVDGPDVHKIELKIGGRKHPAGRFMVHNGKVTHLEDYHGILGAMLPEGEMDSTSISRLHGMKWSPNFAVSPHTMEAPAAPTQPQEVQVHPDPAPLAPPVFEYHRPGMATPHVVEFSGSSAALDGKKLSDPELHLILDNVKSGLGTLRYKRATVTTDMAKALGVDDEDHTLAQTLAPVMDADEALQHIRAGVAAGHIHPDVERAMTQHIYGDSMVQGVGNKAAYQKFRAQNRPGVYVSMDGNHFRDVNNVHGHEAGDQAITGMGGALRDAAARVGTGKLFRPGGDEFVAHFPSYEEASKFMRHATKHLDKLPPVAGRHQLSMSFGLGHDFASSDKALYHAKEQKIDPVTKRSLYTPQKTPHMAHSLVPGTEGPISLHSTTPPATALPKPAAPAAAPTA